ncbi:hypothetical protein D3C85_906680 [compost metagenome]
MADGNAQPGDETQHARRIQQPDIDLTRAEDERQKARGSDNGSRQQRPERCARFAHSGKDGGCLAFDRQAVKHARGGVHPGVARGQHRGQDHGVHYRSGAEHFGPFENQGERADGDIGQAILQQTRVGIRNQQPDHHDGQNVEQQDAPEDLTNRTRDVLARILGFTRCDADELGTLEGEADDHGHADQGGGSAHNGAIADRPKLGAGLFATGDDAKQHQDAYDDEQHDGDDLDQCEPVFRFAEEPDRRQVEPGDDRQEHCAPDKTGRIGKPVGHDDLCRHQVHRDGYRPGIPVVPAKRETEAFVDISRGIGGERAANRHAGRQFAQAGHQEVHHQADDDEGQQRPARTGLRDGRAGGDEQPGADGAANGDHVQVAWREGSFKAT